MPDMDELNKVLSWLENHIPLALKGLRKQGVTESQLVNLKMDLGISLPSQFMSLYYLHNGTENISGIPDAGLFFDLFLMSIEEINEYREIHIGMLEPKNICEKHRNFTVKQRDIHFEGIAAKHWVPFAHDGGGNFIGLDFEPAYNGVMGQVITFGRDEYENYVIAPSFTSFLSWYYGELLKPSLIIQHLSTPGLEGSVDYKIYPTGGFLDNTTRMCKEGLITK